MRCEHMDWEAKQNVLEVAFRKLRSEDDQATLLNFCCVIACMALIKHRLNDEQYSS
jgi:hypothetical protein